MMQAIGTLERAVGRLEQDVARLAAVTPPSPPQNSTPDMDVDGARAALRSLDELIADLKGRTIG
ncbi:hypothetical protein D0Z70_13990 [Sphingobium terrigena]|uniref:Uncharacterized protein n=2 Tax=Sphingobium terrigena TaxID=2304063 RepID=A0A418YQR2_9SPHN|nr:hypothetical protein D0Z70_13990 [Sphingobium terrigena]